MEEYFDVIKRSLELIETIDEGVIYIEEQAAKLRYEEVLQLIRDIEEGVGSIESALTPVFNQLDGHEFVRIADELNSLNAEVVLNYGQGIHERLDGSILQIISVLRNWINESQTRLKSYIAS